MTVESSQYIEILRQYLVVTVVNLGILNFGMSVAWVSPVLVKLREEDNPVLGRPLNDAEGSWVAATSSISSLITIAIGAYLVDKIGRKKCVMLGVIPRICCFVIYLFATEVWMLILARFLSGLADGFIFTIVSMYASEVASVRLLLQKEIRGSLGTMLQIFSSLGILAGYGVGPFLDYYTFNIVILTVCIVDSIPLLFIPDSPYFLYKIGKIEESKKVLIYLRGSPEKAEQDIQEYNMVEETASFSELMQSKTFLKSLGIVMVLTIGSELTGYSAISFYLQTILDSTHTSISSDIASTIMGCIQLSASLFAAFCTDRMGRKPILISGIFGTSIGMIGLGTFFFITKFPTEVVGLLNALPLISLILCIFCFSASVNSIMWPLIAELFDGRGRAIGMAMGMTVGFLCIFLITVFFSSLTTAIGPATTYWAFSGSCILLAMFILIAVPETKGRTFSEIQAMLGGNNESKRHDMKLEEL